MAEFPEEYPIMDKQDKENPIIELLKTINPKREDTFYNFSDQIKDLSLEESKKRIEQYKLDLEKYRYTLYDINNQLNKEGLSEEKSKELEWQKRVITKSINQKKEEIKMLESHIKNLEEKKVSEYTREWLNSLYTETKNLKLDVPSKEIS